MPLSFNSTVFVAGTIVTINLEFASTSMNVEVVPFAEHTRIRTQLMHVRWIVLIADGLTTGIN